MQITIELLKEKNACEEGLRWVIKNNLIGLEDIAFIQKLIENEKLDWANWLIVRVMNYRQYVSYAIFAAEQVIHHKAIDAAKKCLVNPSKVNKKNAAAAAYAAADAAYAAAAADAAYVAAAYAATADAAADAARKQMKLKILEYGLGLLKEAH